MVPATEKDEPTELSKTTALTYLGLDTLLLSGAISFAGTVHRELLSSLDTFALGFSACKGGFNYEHTTNVCDW